MLYYLLVIFTLMTWLSLCLLDFTTPEVTIFLFVVDKCLGGDTLRLQILAFPQTFTH